MELAIWLIVGLIVGGAIGALATWWISRARGGVVSVMQLKKENEKFRDEVAEHFVETARLINQMSDSYKQVFDHLSSGAEKLVDDEKLAARLPPATGQEVRLSQFGASGSAGSAAAKAAKSGSGPGVQNREPKRRESDSHHDSPTDKGAGRAVGGADALKTGSTQTGAKASPPPAADSASGKNEHSSSGGSGKSPADDTVGKNRDPDEKSASGSN